MKTGIMIDLERCIGCWSCSMACKVGNELADDDFRVTVRTLGSGTGIDRPAGIYPELTMGWQPIYNKSCVFCAPRVAEGEAPFCVYNCPTDALAFGDRDNPDSDYSKAVERTRKRGCRIFELPHWEDKKQGITYASKS